LIEKGHHMLVTAALAAIMMIGISNAYGKAFADPIHCDQAGWPSCYKVGYDDGLGMSGPCPSGHSTAFCAGWYVATHNLGSSGGGPPAQQQASPAAQQQIHLAHAAAGATAVVVTPHDRGYAEGYSHWPMSSHNKEYVEDYKLGVRDYAALKTDSSLMFLGTLPDYSTDNYKDFYLGEYVGTNAYWAAQGHNTTDFYKCPLGHSAEFCAGYKFGWGIPSNFDAS
jgi:hypothetical protein